MSSTPEGWEESAGPDGHRRLQNIIRVGKVSQVDFAKYRVRVKSGELESNWIPWGSSKAGKTKRWSPPEVGEQVLLASPGGDLSRSVVLCSIFSDELGANGDIGTVDRTTYEDGTIVEYDQASHKLTAKLASGGTAEIEAPGGVTIKGDVTIEGALSVSKQLDVSEDITAQGEITTLKAGAPVNESTHIHPHPMGPTSSPTPGT